MSIEGHNDFRLVKFARACADAGLKVIIPHLPGLMGFRFAHNDLQRLIDIAGLVTQDHQEELGLIGFSTGGSYSLLMAGHPGLQDKIGPVVLFSPLYDARDVATRLHAPPNPAPQTPKAWDHFYWTQFFIAYRNQKRLKIPDVVQELLKILLTDWEGHSLDVKRVFYENFIHSLRLYERTNLMDEGTALEQLSPRGQIACCVKSPVFIIHDSADMIVPPYHSLKIHDELSQRGADFRQEILVTPWLSHVVLQNTGNLSELTRIVSFTAELFR
jgi:pimeloyl-ACP methyl ester carboxylesterase